MSIIVASACLVILTSTWAQDGPGESPFRPVMVGDVSFDRTAQIGKMRVPFRGGGLLEFWGFDVYSAAFYVSRDKKTAQEMLADDTPRKLEIFYHRRLSMDDFIEATDEGIKANPNVDRGAIQEEIEEVCGCYLDVEEADRYSIVYEPGEGTTLYLNGEMRCFIAGAEFARAYFGIWVSENALNQKLAPKLRGTD